MFAENSVCISCGTPQGFSLAEMRFLPVDPVSGRAASADAVQCANLRVNGCNWLLDDGHPSRLCPSCRLTRMRPNDTDRVGLAAWWGAETAKRRLVYQLHDLGLPIVPLSQDARGLAFDLLSSAEEPVTTGHAAGVVTIDLAEGHDAHREATRVAMGEPYRTMLGHLRHEVGHYYWQVLVGGHGPPAGATDPTALQRFRDLFGDESEDYAAALERHYSVGAPADWQSRYVSAYATAHVWEDWAETFAHYLHIRDTLQTAAAYGLFVTGPEVTGAQAADLVALPAEDAGAHETIRSLVSTWLALTYALNAVNRSMGKDDLYPFVLTPPVITKLGFVHDLVVAAADRKSVV